MGVDIEQNAKEEYKRGLKCCLWGTFTVEMTREQLISFVGFLDAQIEHERFDHVFH